MSLFDFPPFANAPCPTKIHVTGWHWAAPLHQVVFFLAVHLARELLGSQQYPSPRICRGVSISVCGWLGQVKCLWGCGSAEGAMLLPSGGAAKHHARRVRGRPLDHSAGPSRSHVVTDSARRSSGGVMAFRAAGAKLRNGEGLGLGFQVPR